VLPGTPFTSDETLLRWWSWHAAGPHFVMLDGSARSISPDVDQAMFLALSTRAGGEAMTVP